jgi:endonuclease/exonuclease/phosphatase family metal-dependent hydrolase
VNEDAMDICIVTCNTWKGDGAYAKRLALAAEQLAQIRPDILCLQESLKAVEKGPDTAAFLAEKLEMDAVFTPAREKVRECNGVGKIPCYSGLALLTTLPVVRQQVTSLGGAEGDPERIAQHFVLLVDGKNLVVTNLHLTHLADHDMLRLNQLAIAAGDPFNDLRIDYRLVCGDFNCSWQEMKPWRNSRADRVIDCYQAGNGKMPGGTLVTKPGRRIDHILCIAPSPEAAPACHNAAVVLDKSDASGLLPSDHYAVSVDLSL